MARISRLNRGSMSGITRIKYKMLNCAIGIVLYKRPQYTKLLFDNLKANDYSNLFPVYVSIDFSEHNDEILEIVKRHKDALNIVEVKVNNPMRGCGFNHCNLIEMIKEESFIILEDDAIPLAHDALNYFYSHISQLIENDLFSICGYNKEGNIDQVYNTVVRNYFCPWGFSFTRKKWNEVKEQVFDKNWQQYGSWDTAIMNMIENRNTIYPELSRIQNVGALNGTYVQNSEWHHANHWVEKGAWDIEGIQKRELGKWITVN